ncbi:MAG TPA: peptidoglycan-binding domain-containing protein [Chthoniobacterales bacterium]|nr:peptidoglycan-binding domain-containing protein [Chthoniobacterales bacterium]
MDAKLFIASLLAVIGLVAPVQAGNGHHGGSGGNFVSGRSGAGRGVSPSFSSMPARSFGGNRMMYSGQRFSSYGMRSPNVMRYHPQSVNSNFGAQRLAQGNFQANRFNHSANNPRIGANRNGFASNNHALNSQRFGSGQFRNAQGRLAPNWKNHVVAQHAGNWHSNWSHNHSHWWHGHNWCFIGGSWFAFDVGFSPWWPWWWDYPYYGYGYGYPYGYGYGYNYGNGYDQGYGDSGVYDSQPADQNGYDDQSGSQNGDSSYNNQSANSTVAGAQDRLTQEGFYHGQIDGVLGPETRHAIVRFQTKHGLRISGELSNDTLNAMGLRQYANY